MKSRVLAFLFLAISVLPLKVSAFTLIRSGSGVTATGWGTDTVTFDIDTSCNSYLSYVDSAVDGAANIWGHVSTSALQVVRGGATTLANPITTYVGNSASQYAPSGNAIVYCDQNFQSDSGQDANSIPGFATGQNIASDGSISGCLLVLNVESGGQASITTLDTTVVNTVLTHEIGHCLGLGHSSDPNALMYYATGAGRKTVLAQDDIDGITYLYPSKEGVRAFSGCSALAVERDRRIPIGRGPWRQIFDWALGDLISAALILFGFRYLVRRSSVASRI